MQYLITPQSPARANYKITVCSILSQKTCSCLADMAGQVTAVQAAKSICYRHALTGAKCQLKMASKCK